MAQATLKSPLKRYSLGGVIFEAEVPKTVDMEFYRMYEDNPRLHFKLDSSDHAALAVDDKTGRPRDKMTRIEAIRNAIDELDEDADDAWMKDGRPDARALTSALGWQVTSQERDE